MIAHTTKKDDELRLGSKHRSLREIPVGQLVRLNCGRIPRTVPGKKLLRDLFSRPAVYRSLRSDTQVSQNDQVVIVWRPDLAKRFRGLDKKNSRDKPSVTGRPLHVRDSGVLSGNRSHEQSTLLLVLQPETLVASQGVLPEELILMKAFERRFAELKARLTNLPESNTGPSSKVQVEDSQENFELEPFPHLGLAILSSRIDKAVGDVIAKSGLVSDFVDVTSVVFESPSEGCSYSNSGDEKQAKSRAEKLRSLVEKSLKQLAEQPEPEYRLLEKPKKRWLAVVDTGLDAKVKESEFSGREVRFADFSGGQQLTNGVLPSDACPNAHGSGVAALAAGNISGVANDVGVYALKVFGHDSNKKLVATVSDIIRALDWILSGKQEMPSLINLSLTVRNATTKESRTLQVIMQRLEANGVHVLAAVGNNSPPGTHFPPANHPFVYSVGSVNTSNEMSGFSNRAKGVGVRCRTGKDFLPEFIAHGENVTVRGVGGAWRIASGTSFASPIVAGALAETLRWYAGDPRDADVVRILESLGQWIETGTDPHDGSCLLVFP